MLGLMAKIMELNYMIIISSYNFQKEKQNTRAKHDIPHCCAPHLVHLQRAPVDVTLLSHSSERGNISFKGMAAAGKGARMKKVKQRRSTPTARTTDKSAQNKDYAESVFEARQITGENFRRYRVFVGSLLIIS